MIALLLRKKPGRGLVRVAALFATMRLFAAEMPLALEPIFEIGTGAGTSRFLLRGEMTAEKREARIEDAPFLAVCMNEWPAGLIPIFAVQKENHFELRRRPPRGEENSSEPFFFALPPADEPDAARISGHWRCNATRGAGADSSLAWQLASEGEKLSGRFDPNSEYRVAFLAGGTFRSNRIELRVEYFMDAYVLTGDWLDGRLKGHWRHTEDSEHGTWEAQRDAVPLPGNTNIVALCEWRRAADGARRYALDGEPISSGWERSTRPLCRVWRGTPGRKN
jgi:hypothetical protein